MLQTLLGHGPFYRVYNQCRDRQKVLFWMMRNGDRKGCMARVPAFVGTEQVYVIEGHTKETMLLVGHGDYHCG